MTEFEGVDVGISDVSTQYWTDVWAETVTFGVRELAQTEYGEFTPYIEVGLPPVMMSRSFWVNSVSEVVGLLNCVQGVFELTGRQIPLVLLYIIKGWIEAIVGKVCSGYVVDQFGSKIATPKGGYVLLQKGTGLYINDVSGKVDENSFYQVFLKSGYTDWHLIVTSPIGWQDVAWRKCPDDPPIPDDDLPDKRDLCFYIPQTKIIRGVLSSDGKYKFTARMEE